MTTLITSKPSAWAVAKRIRTGTMSVNGGVWYGAQAPFGGFKASGVGRQNGHEGFAQYTETKIVAGSIDYPGAALLTALRS